MDSETIQQLTAFGLTEYQARVYLALTLKGPQKASALALASGIPRPHIYSTLKVLEEKGFITSIPKKIVEFKAQPIEEALKITLEDRKQSIVKLEEMGKYLAEKLIKGQDAYLDKTRLIRVYRGNSEVRNGLRNIFSKIKKRCYFLTNDPRDAHLGGLVYDRDVLALYKYGVEMRGLVPVEEDNIEIIEKLSPFVAIRHIDNPSILNAFTGQYLEHNERPRLRVIITDNEEVLYVISNQDDSDEYAIHSRQKEMVGVTALVYSYIWNSSPDLAFKKLEIDRGMKPGSVAIISSDKEFETIARGIISRASSYFYGVLSQEQFIYSLTSAITEAREQTSRGVKIKIAVDVKSDISAGLKAFEDIGAEIRHLPGTHIPMMLINDDEAIVELINSEPSGSGGSKTGVYISDPTGILRLKEFIEKEWANSIDVCERIEQIHGAGYKH